MKRIKKPAKKALSREDKITRVLSKVAAICDYAVEHLYTQQAQFEELEWMLRDYIK